MTLNNKRLIFFIFFYPKIVNCSFSKEVTSRIRFMQQRQRKKIGLREMF